MVHVKGTGSGEGDEMKLRAVEELADEFALLGSFPQTKARVEFPWRHCLTSSASQSRLSSSVDDARG